MSRLYTLMLVIYFTRYVNCFIDNDIWWGPEELKSTYNDSIRPFRIDFEDEMIQDLRYRLKHHRPSKPTFPGVGFQYGFNTKELKKWTDYWADDYQFKKQEEFLNQFPQYKTNIQGLDIHYIRVSPQVPPGIEVVPLLLLHGWPGSLREFYEAIPLLTAVSDDRDFAVEVVAPSLPGFGFSDAAVRPGLSSQNITTIFKNLMHRLGHKKFYLQGGDWGRTIGTDMITIYPEIVLGFHTNLGIALTPKSFLMTLLGSIIPSLVVDPALADRLYPLTGTILRLLRESGYFHILSTKPDSMGVGLSDSPAGLLAFFFQLVSTGTRPYYLSREDGGLDHYQPDALIDNLMFYWASNSITSSFRIYAESLNMQFSPLVIIAPTNVPTWVLQGRYELVYDPPVNLKTKYKNLIHTTVLEEGGHFIALEMPRVFAEDVLKAIAAFRKLH